MMNEPIGQLMIFATREVWTDSIALRFGIRDGDHFSVARTLVWELVPRGALAPDDSLLRLRPEAAQRLMDELWNVGLRPSEGSGSAGQLAAVQNHLEDMRTIAMSQLGIASS